MNLFHVISSPHKERSASIEVADAFIDAWLVKNPGGVVETLNVWETEFPEFDGKALNAKYAGLEGKALTRDQDKTWSQIKGLPIFYSRRRDPFQCPHVELRYSLQIEAPDRPCLS